MPKTELRPLRHASDFSLPAVPARFETASTRKLETSSIGKVSAISKIDDNFDIKGYGSASTNTPKLVDASKRMNFFETSTSKSAINFADCKFKSDRSSCELTKHSTEPSAKRRKFKVLPVEFNTNISEPSTSVNSINETFSNVDDTKTTNIPKKPVSDDKKELGKSYLKRVKRTLSDEKYKIFGSMIQSYTKNGDFDELLRTLEILFPASDKLEHLFVGKNLLSLRLHRPTKKKVK